MDEPLEVILTLVWIATIWAAVLGGLHLLGWRRLQRRFVYDGPKPAQLDRFVSGSVGLVGYSRCLTVGADGAGLYLKTMFPIGVFDRPILIPWTELGIGTARRVLWARIQRLEAGGVRFDIDAAPFSRLYRLCTQDLRLAAAAPLIGVEVERV